MTLQRKFAALLTVLALAVSLNLLAAVWTFLFIERELVRPLADIKVVLPRLAELKHGITDQAAQMADQFAAFPLRQVHGERSPTERRLGFDAAANRVDTALLDLESLDQYRGLLGISTTRSLRARIENAKVESVAWFEAHAEPSRVNALTLFHEVHDLIERMEAKVTASAASAAVDEYAPSIRIWLLVVMFASLVIVALTAALGVILVRRWVTRPIGILRDAAVRLAKGEFSHRVPVGPSDELGLLSAEINQMAGMISSLQEERIERERLAAAGEVIRRLAHNIRNPLAGIRSLAELSRSSLPPHDPGIESQTRIIQTVDRFERWLTELLHATTPPNLSLQPEDVRVADWLDGVITPLRAAAAAKGVSLEVDSRHSPPVATFDPRHLEQALVGIVNNAIQASPNGKAVTVAATSNHQTWQLSVTDRGAGVPSELSDRVFRPYFTTKPDGTGIGLAVAKQVVDQHAGRIRIESAADPTTGGSGARFVVELPLAGPPKVANTGQ